MIKEKEFTAQIAPGLFRSIMEAALVDQEIALEDLRGVAIEKNGTEDITSYKFLIRYQDRPKTETEDDIDDDLEEELGPRQEDCDGETCESCQ